MLKIIQDEKIDKEIIKMHTSISKLLCIITLFCTTPLYAKSNDENQTASYTADAVMLAPFSQQTLNKFQLKFQPDQMSYTIINDLGGNQTFEVK